MHPVWGNLFEYFKERRLAARFYLTLGLLLILLALAAVFFQYVLKSWPLVVLVLLLFVAREILEIRRQRRNRYKTSPLSRDELNKARSKLMKAKR